MRVLLVQLDGKWPNVALMRLAAHHRDKGDEIAFRLAPGAAGLQRDLTDVGAPDRVYGSLIFEWTRPLARQLLALYPSAILGGAGWDETVTLERLGITTKRQDYSIYPGFAGAIGYSQRGCRLKCPFCKVPKLEPGPVREANTIPELVAGRAPRLVLLDNDPFGQKRWRQRVREMRALGIRVAFTQGINARTLTAREARAVASLDTYDDSFTKRSVYVAWDNRADEERLFRGLERLKRAGVKPGAVVVYMLVGYWDGAHVHEDDFYRVEKLLAWGARPFPMPFKKTPELLGFARWVIGSHAKRGVTWDAWVKAKCQPRNLHRKPSEQRGLFSGATA